MITIEKTILRKKPHVLVIGGESKLARTLQYDLQRIIEGFDDETNERSLSVEIIDPEPSRIYATSKRAIVNLLILEH
jgi:hypothetical protein